MTNLVLKNIKKQTTVKENWTTVGSVKRANVSTLEHEKNSTIKELPRYHVVIQKPNVLLSKRRARPVHLDGSSKIV